MGNGKTIGNVFEGGGIGCPLCAAAGAEPYFRDSRGGFWLLCAKCDLVFLSPSLWLDAAEEKKRYDLHENSPDDPRYRAFLNQLFTPICRKVAVGASGLDFGCGPGPTLAVMLAESGRPTALYDPFYHPDESVWKRRYDFIVASEVFEHLRQPAREMDKLLEVLKPGGWLGVMTWRRPAKIEDFANWGYRHDDTHILFHSDKTFEHIADKWNLELEFDGNRVALLRLAG